MPESPYSGSFWARIGRRAHLSHAHLEVKTGTEHAKSAGNHGTNPENSSEQSADQRFLDDQKPRGDRMRFAFPPLTPVVRAMLIVLFGSFVVQSVAFGIFQVQLSDWLALHTTLGIPLTWQWATYPLVEMPGPSAVVARGIDLLLIYSFGAYVESHLGRNRSLQLIAASIIGGALLPFAFGLLFPAFSIPIMGATVITWALMGAFAVITRGAPVGFFLMPSMSAWVFIGIFLVIVGLQSLWAQTPIPLLTALSAVASGILFTRWLERRPPRPKKGGNPPRRRNGAPHLSVITGGQASDDRTRWLN